MPAPSNRPMPEPLAAQELLCAVCPRPGKVCKQCNNIRYCSKTCQKSDWPLHRVLCHTFKDFDDGKRPGQNFKRAIHFPVDGKPRFVWMETSVNAWGENEGKHLGTLLGDDKPFLEHQQIRYDAVLDRNTLHSVILVMRENSMTDGSVVNSGIHKITGGTSSRVWRGSVVACGGKGQSRSPIFAEDLDTFDLKVITDYLLNYFDGDNTKRVDVMVINCNHLVNNHGKLRFEKAQITPSHKISREYRSSDIATLIGMPLALSALDDNSGNPENDSGNEFAVALDLNCGLRNEDLDAMGNTSFLRPPSVGSIIVVRRDRKTLDPSVLEIMCTWSLESLSPHFARAKEGFVRAIENLPENSLSYGNGADKAVEFRKKMIDEITKDTFDAWQKENLVLGVQVHCDGEHKVLGKPYFQPVSILPAHQVFCSDEAEISQIATRIGMPLLTLRVPTPEVETDYTVNRFAVFMNMGCNLHTQKDWQDWGWMPEAWFPVNMGNVIVARKDKQPLSAKTLEVLCVWSVEVLQPAMEMAMEESAACIDIAPKRARKIRNKVMEKITKKEFEVFEKEYLETGRCADKEEHP